jgi:ABC-2 type transport system permease protein
VDRRVLFEAPEAKATAKDFYRDVLSVLHLSLLVPLIALFYAAGVLEDEKDKGNLPYMLTRPVPRWMMPVARFLVSFVVAGAALAIGVIATFLLLLGQPQEAPGFLTWPLLYVLMALFAYSGLWSLAGVTVRRPYLLGLVYILGLEAVIVLGRGILVNGEPLLQDWILWFSLNHWMHEAFAGWDPAAPWSMLPGGDALRGLLIVLAVGVVGLAGSAWWMTRREFEV